MTGKEKLQIGMLCYPRLTQLDLTGPYEVLCRMPDTEVHIIWKHTKPVRTESGFCIVPCSVFATPRSSTWWSCPEDLGSRV